MSMIDDLKNLDPNNPGSWPKLVQMILFVVIFAAVVYLGWKFYISSQQEQLKTLEAQEVTELETLEEKQARASNLEPLKLQMEEIEQSFGDLVRQLPDETEVAGLLIDISQTGLGAGLEFTLFRPGNLQDAEYYRALPIEIEVTGNFHQFGEFVSGLVALPRIVTVHDMQISSAEGDSLGRGDLLIKTRAQTYQAVRKNRVTLTFMWSQQYEKKQ